MDLSKWLSGQYFVNKDLERFKTSVNCLSGQYFVNKDLERFKTSVNCYDQIYVL